jgi:3-methyl-2-oxobutanoate hydroxymethyltransferase
MKQSISSLASKKSSKVPISWLTCYDYSTACALNASNLDMILVGDSGGMTVLGYMDTVPVSMEEMLFLCKAVRRGAPDKFIVGDMPKGSYEISNEEAMKNAMRFIKEAGCDAVKLEGSGMMIERIAAISAAGIPVVGHLGLTPQTSAQFGGYRVVGKTSSEAERLKDDALRIQSAGAFALLLEATPPSLSGLISKSLEVLCLGIGAGREVDGQLLILHDLLGLYPTFRPKFAKCYIPQILHSFSDSLLAQHELVKFGKETRMDGFFALTLLAVNEFIQEVVSGSFPDATFSY